jgi:hypothetical protein
MPHDVRLRCLASTLALLGLLGASPAFAAGGLFPPVPAWARATPPGAVRLTEATAVGAWQEDLEPTLHEANGRPSFPGMTWVLRADHTITIFGSCRDLKPGPKVDGTWELDAEAFLHVRVTRKSDGAMREGTMPAWSLKGRLALPPNHPGETTALNRYDGPLPPKCVG